MTETKWYFRPWAIIVALLLVGPFALPLVWLSPSMKVTMKTLVTILVIAFTIWYFITAVQIFNSLMGEFKQIDALTR